MPISCFVNAHFWAYARPIKSSSIISFTGYFSEVWITSSLRLWGLARLASAMCAIAGEESRLNCESTAYFKLVTKNDSASARFAVQFAYVKQQEPTIYNFSILIKEQD